MCSASESNKIIHKYLLEISPMNILRTIEKRCLDILEHTPVTKKYAFNSIQMRGFFFALATIAIFYTFGYLTASLLASSYMDCKTFVCNDYETYILHHSIAWMLMLHALVSAVIWTLLILLAFRISKKIT